MTNTEALAILEHQKEFNRLAEDWGRSTRSRYLMELRQLPFSERVMWATRGSKDILRGRVQLRLKRQYGNVYRVSWPFARHGIFQELGVGRGRRKGSGKEKPMPWIVPTLDAMTPELADAMQDASITSLGKVIRIKVNGLFEFELK